jgi:uncharacterized membrane protein (UPF0127 family)
MRKPRFTRNMLVPGLIVIAVAVLVIIALVIGTDKKAQPKSTKPVASNTQATACGPYRKDGIVTVNGHKLNIETAAGATELTKGLSGRPCIESNWGMLFDFGHDGQYAIWMKDMNFPIDVIWINSSHTIVAMEIDFQPSTYNRQNPEKSDRRINQSPARYVLEVKANLTKQLGLALGQPIAFHKIQST